MRGPDAAASVARGAEVTVGAVEGPLWKKFRNNLCAYSAEGGHLAVLQWARAQGCRWTAETCEVAAENGRLAVLRGARAQGCPWDAWTCA